MSLIAKKIVGVFEDLFFFTWDVSCALVNILTPKRKLGHVVPEGHPGAGGKWPEFIPPKGGDSRSACPCINALANHGILPRDGRNISFKELSRVAEESYNFSPSFSYFVPNYAARILKKSYRKDTFDLEELSLHNGIEHDASLTRRDVKFQPDQGVPDLPLVRGLLDSATGTDAEGNKVITKDDLALYAAKCRQEAKESNPDFSLSMFHKLFGSSNSSTMLIIFGGRVKDLETMLVEERIPEGWEPRIRAPKGLTFLNFNNTVLPVEIKTALNKKKVSTDKAE